MHLINLLALAVGVSGTATIVRANGAGCGNPRVVCFGATPGNCCRVPFPNSMFPMRARGVSILLNQESNLAVSVPYARGDGTYCGTPITNEATFGDISCYQGNTLGSGLYIECPVQSAKFARTTNASELVERANSPLCPNHKRDEPGDANIASVFTDEHGNATDVQGYIDAVNRMEAGIAQHGEKFYYLNKQTGLAPEDMVFDVEPLATRAGPIATAYAGIHHCSGENLASITDANTCYTTGEGASVQLLQEIPQRCVLTTWAGTPDCSGEGTTIAAAGSPTGCLSGMDFDSIRLDCTQKKAVVSEAARGASALGLAAGVSQ
ncbi:hypothetical protein PRZ48_006877 [Zasmidium cellare]|uniref:Uncharacterized protein n=1 Tax=Zasmidium cellare TaxID=395010 RepID=A0ABR0EIJ8_ZASCE|nr:hypothetical protein PRZ48_006877 [Zasmidium cellare]